MIKILPITASGATTALSAIRNKNCPAVDGFKTFELLIGTVNNVDCQVIFV